MKKYTDIHNLSPRNVQDQYSGIDHDKEQKVRNLRNARKEQYKFSKYVVKVLPWVSEGFLLRKRSNERALWLVVAASPLTVHANEKGKKIPLAPKALRS